METRQYISEELFNKMQEAVNTNGEQFQYSYSDICVLLVKPKSLHLFKPAKKVFRILIKKNWYSIDTKVFSKMSLEDLNSRFQENIFTIDEAPDIVCEVCE